MEKINSDILIADFDSQIQLKLAVNYSVCKELIPGLFLLRENLLPVLNLDFNNFTLLLCLNDRNESVCTMYDSKNKKAKMAISMNALEYFLYFLLKFYRDRSAESEHIDIDFNYEKNTDLTLTIQADIYTDLSPEAMNKLMG